MIKFTRIYLFSQGLFCFISYSEHLSVIYNNKNYGSFPYIIFIAVENNGITLDRPQCIAICSKFKMASVLLKNSIIHANFTSGDHRACVIQVCKGILGEKRARTYNFVTF